MGYIPNIPKSAYAPKIKAQVTLSVTRLYKEGILAPQRYDILTQATSFIPKLDYLLSHRRIIGGDNPSISLTVFLCFLSAQVSSIKIRIGTQATPSPTFVSTSGAIRGTLH